MNFYEVLGAACEEYMACILFLVCWLKKMKKTSKSMNFNFSNDLNEKLEHINDFLYAYICKVVLLRRPE